MLETLIPKCENLAKKRLLSFSQKSITFNYNNPINQMKNLLENKHTATVVTQITPERILDAPNLIDDYYMNLLDWGTTNILAISLSNSVYLWNGNTYESNSLTSANDNICSVSWMNSGTCLALGMTDGSIELWDTIKHHQIRSMTGHLGRVCALSWNGYILSSGSKDSNIINHDVRIRDHNINTMIGHTQEVCNLKWSSDGVNLASGGNDNLLNIWDINNSSYQKYKFTDHEAAVKAISWSNWQKNILASGGGSKDKTIKFWNTDTGNLLSSHSVGSQVCALLWDKHEKGLISSHGYSKNQICLWKYPNMIKSNELNGHMSRVLYLSSSPDGNYIVSGSGDETLRFWKIHEGNRRNDSEYDFNYKSSSSKILNSFQVR
jgi:cell division cycle protein 20 (cofactor of APC complex)